MNGLMMNAPLLISAQLEFASRFHSLQEVVTRTVEGPITRTTWGHVAARTRKLANALKALGVKEGDVVATLAWNTQRHLELYFAVSGIGAVLHTINPRLPPDQLSYIAKDASDSFAATMRTRYASGGSSPCTSSSTSIFDTKVGIPSCCRISRRRGEALARSLAPGRRRASPAAGRCLAAPARLRSRPPLGHHSPPMPASALP